MNRVYAAEVAGYGYRPNGAVRGLTYPEACGEAKAILAGMDPAWEGASCQEIATHIAQDCTIFVGDDPIRVALTGTSECPVTIPSGGNNMLLLGIVGLAVVGAVAVAIASQGKKKVLIAKLS